MVDEGFKAEIADKLTPEVNPREMHQVFSIKAMYHSVLHSIFSPGGISTVSKKLKLINA